MKRTASKICALLFCVVLWFNPVGAQQLKKAVVEENNNTELKMDKAVPQVQQLQRMQAAKGEARLDFQPVQKVLKAKEHSTNPKYSELQGLTQEQKLNMVKESMKKAFAAAPKAADDAGKEHVFLGGSSGYNDVVRAVYVDEERTVLELCSFPYGYQGTRMHTHWGTWNGTVYEGIYAAGNSIVGYFTYDPRTEDTEDLTDQYLNGSMDNIDAAACAYDYSTNKVYTLTNNYTDDWSAITSIDFHSANKGTAIFSEAFSIEINTENIPVAMAIDKTGKFYIFCTDGKVYTVQNTAGTYSLAEVGDTKQPTDTYSQSAAWDYRSDKVYWANINMSGVQPAAMMSVWDPQNSQTSVQLGSFIQIKALASVFYTDENPEEVADFGLNYSGGK
ncbi:MAG: hypothetical protein J1F29_03330, partial [Lentimicrobiaceae bacterium]|nr:hypothetical protein [Lentimicrobiaceae bacterium]